MFICHFPHRKHPPPKKTPKTSDWQPKVNTCHYSNSLHQMCRILWKAGHYTRWCQIHKKKFENEFSIARSEVICNNIKRGGICHFLFRIFDNKVSVENAPNKRNRYTWWMMIPLIGSMTLQWASHLSAEYSQLRDRSHIVSGLDLKNNTINISNNLNLTTLYSQERPYNFFKNCKSIEMTYERRNASLKI